MTPEWRVVLIAAVVIVVINLWVAWVIFRWRREVKRWFDDLHARLDELYAEPKWRHGELFRASGPWKFGEPSDS